MLLLITLLAPNLIRARYRAQLTACMDQIKAISTALEQYSVETKVYPLALNAAFCQNYMGRPVVECPSSKTPYTLQVDNIEHSFTLICQGGVHHIALPNYVDPGFPQFSHNIGTIILK